VASPQAVRLDAAIVSTAAVSARADMSISGESCERVSSEDDLPDGRQQARAAESIGQRLIPSARRLVVME